MWSLNWDKLTLAGKLELWREYVGEEEFDGLVLDILLTKGKVEGEEILHHFTNNPAYDIQEYIDSINKSWADDFAYRLKEGK